MATFRQILGPVWGGSPEQTHERLLEVATSGRIPEMVDATHTIGELQGVIVTPDCAGDEETFGQIVEERFSAAFRLLGERRQSEATPPEAQVS